MPYAKNKIRVNVPRRSGFDKTHRNSGSLTCGTLTPILCDELIPGTRVSLKLPIAVELPPLASDTYMNLKLKAEAFFCPSRLCCSSFEDFFCDNNPVRTLAADVSTTNIAEVIPRVPYFTPSDASSLGPGSLADYLGIKVPTTAGQFSFNALPFVAYHLIWQEWYRNPRVQREAFVKPLNYLGGGSSVYLRCLPYVYFTSDSSSTTYDALPDLGTASTLADNTSIFSLRQRNFGLDYFTGSRVSAQQGTAVSLNVPIAGSPVTVTDADGNPQQVIPSSATSGFTIAALRAANSLQQFRERNNLPSPRLVDQVKARYGAILSDGVAQRPICIGSASYDVDSTGVNQTAVASTPSTNNPFDSVGSQYGRAYAAGSDFIIRDFTANEPGYLMVLISLVPERTYSTGIDRMFKRYLSEGSIVDMANPLLQNVGDQPVYQHELEGVVDAYTNHIFGYQDRYGDFMYKPNSAHGLMRDGQSLASYVLQDSFAGGSAIDISSSFLQIPKNYLDPVFAVSSAVSGLSAWYDSRLEYKVSMPLAEFSIPSLQDPAYEHGKPVSLIRNGQIF